MKRPLYIWFDKRLAYLVVLPTGYPCLNLPSYLENLTQKCEFRFSFEAVLDLSLYDPKQCCFVLVRVSDKNNFGYAFEFPFGITSEEAAQLNGPTRYRTV